MTIKQLIDTIEAAKPTGWQYYAGHTAEAYNAERTIQSTMVLVVPNPYPLFWRDECQQQIELKLLYLQLVNVFDSAQGTQHHLPWSSAEDRAQLYEIVRDSVQVIAGLDYISIREVKPVRFYDSPDGPTVNRQIMAEVIISATVTQKPDTVVYLSDEDGNLLTDEEGNYLTE